jgi:signal transduction histidine kinase/DNA-binding response OmpR family regulator
MDPHPGKPVAASSESPAQGKPPPKSSWLGVAQGGEMAARIQAFDWGQTSLGPLERWPEDLRASLRLCLASRFPMHIWWGAELINLYNDAFIPVLGRRHPEALGRPAAAIWAEAWAVISPQTEAVMGRGESTWNERAHFVLSRNGFPEEAWFTWSYSPIRNEAGGVVGLHGMWVDETSRMLAEKSRTRLADEQLRKVADESARTILESITEAFFSLDQDWRFTYLNPQSFVLLGRPPQDLVGKNLWEEYPGLYGSPFEPIYRGVAATRKAASIIAYFPDHKRWYDVRAYPAEGGGLSVYFCDVSLQKRADEEKEKLWESERRARSESERAGRLKDEFLATLSHELRTPLNAILGWCDILIRTDVALPPQITDGLNTIERNARAQAQIIADILDMSSIIAGKMRVLFRPLDLAVVVREAVETARPSAETKGIRLQCTLDASASRITGDPSRLQQILWNLLSNAVKFTPKDGQVEVKLARVDSHLEVSISDTGIGVKPEFLPYVFDRFRQADASTTRQHGGLGLGLSIVKQLVEIHGGTITVESAGEGRGATFVMALPLSAVEPPEEQVKGGRDQPREPMRRVLPEGGLKGVRVLVADDEPDSRAFVQRLLEDYGARVTAVASASAAYERLQEERPDVLVSDIGMPGEDGYSLVRRIRALSPAQGGEIPALALTAYARPEDRERSFLAGFQTHIPKPVEPLDLVLSVANLARPGDDFTGHLPPGVGAVPGATPRTKLLRILLVEDHASTRELLATLLGQRRHRVTAVGSSSEARAAAEKGQFDLVISDVGLPDGTGVELMSDLREKFGLTGIALSGFGDTDDIARSREAGFVAHLIKPVSIGALEEALASASQG